MNWSETKDKLTFEQEQDRRSDYFLTFYSSESARRVFADIRTHVLGLEVSTPESAIAKLALLDLIESIKESCGISNQYDIVDAEIQVKRQLNEREKENLIN